MENLLVMIKEEKKKMNEIGEKYLPIGTVVMLKGGSKRLMITGFCSMPVDNKNTVYDYAGCMYPEGFLSSDQTALFNHDQIEKVYYMGLVDEEEEKFKQQLNAIVDVMQKGSSSIESPASPSIPEESKENSNPAPAEVPETPVAPVSPTASAANSHIPVNPFLDDNTTSGTTGM